MANDSSKSFNITTIYNQPNSCLVYYLMSSYLYYKMQCSVITDYEFDMLAKLLLDQWDKVSHIHKALIDVEDLKAGTGYAIREYPKIVQGAALEWYKDIKGVYP